MKNCRRVVTAIAAALVFAALLLVQSCGRGQAPTPPVNADEKAKTLRTRRIAQQLEAQGRLVTVFDREGKVVATVGERAIYDDVVISPDGKRLALPRRDLENQSTDVWVVEIDTGKSTRISHSSQREFADTPAWSPDGSQVAYFALRGGYACLFRKASNGEGAEELLYRSPGGPMSIGDWSLDGRFLSFSRRDLTGGTLYALPLAGSGERKPIEVFRSAAQLIGSSFSPENGFVSYASDESGKNEIYVRPFDASADAGAAPAAGPWQISPQGGQWVPVSGWRRDGREMYYLASDGGLMAVEVSTVPTFKFGKPKLLFRLSQAVPAVFTGLISVSRDGQRVAIAVPAVPTLQQITVFDREGKILSKVGEPGPYLQASLSPDGTRVAVMRTDPRESDVDIWTLDVATGKSTPVTNDTLPENAPIWSPDGNQVAYASRRGSFTSIYRKAWDGTGDEEQLFRYTPGAGLVLTDWSPDGKFLSFHDGCSGVLHVLPLRQNEKALERKAIDWLRDEYNVAQARFSPDFRFMAYLSAELKTKEETDAGIFDVYVRPFDANQSDVSTGGEKPVQVSTEGALGMIFWRQDGKEMYYLTPDWEVMAVEVTTTPTFQATTPKLLFKLPIGLPGPFLFGNPQQWRNVSRDGQRFVFTMNVPASILAR